MDFLELRLNQGDEEARCHDLFLASGSRICSCSASGKGVNGHSCVRRSAGLNDVYGEEFNELYLKYESEGRARKTVPAAVLGNPSSKVGLRPSTHTCSTRTASTEEWTKFGCHQELKFVLRRRVHRPRRDRRLQFGVDRFAKYVRDGRFDCGVCTMSPKW